MVVRFSEVSEGMLELGYEPIPSYPSKIPAFEGWRDVRVNLEQVRKWNGNGMADLNASTRLGRIVRPDTRLAMIDVDVLDVAGAKRMWSVISEVTAGAVTGFRCGNAPKFALPVLVQGVSKKRKSDIFVDLDGNECAVEVLNEGQHVVMYGEQSYAGGTREYQWFRCDPMTTPVAELPVVNSRQIDQIFDAFAKYAEVQGWDKKTKKPSNAKVKRSTGSAAPADVIDALDNVKVPSATLLELETHLRRIPADVGNDEWFRILAAVHFETEGSEEGLELVDLWSSGAFSGVRPNNYLGLGDVRNRYNSFKDDASALKTTIGTLRAIAVHHNGEVDPDPVVSIADVEDVEMSKPYAPTEDITLGLPPVMLDIIDYYRSNCTSLYAPTSAAMTAMHVISFAMQRSFGLLRNGAVVARSNLYHLQILPTGVGKAAMNTTIANLLESVMEPERCQGLIHNVGSGQGLEDLLLKYPNMLWTQDEIADVLGENGNVKSLRDDIKRMYSLSSEGIKQRALVESGNRKKLDPVQRPHLSVIGSTTPEKMASVVNHIDKVDGFLNRWVAAYTPSSELVVLPFNEGTAECEVPASFIDWFESLEMRMDLSISSEFGATAMTPDILRLPKGVSRKIYEDQISIVRDDRSPSASLRVRKFENAMKIALVIQLAEDPWSTEVSQANWDWALRYVDNGITTLYNLTVRNMVDPSTMMQDHEVMRNIRELLEEPFTIASTLTGMDAKITETGVVKEAHLSRVLSRSSRLDREMTMCLTILNKNGEVGHYTGLQLKNDFGIPIGPKLMKTKYYFSIRKRKQILTNLKELRESIV